MTKTKHDKVQEAYDKTRIDGKRLPEIEHIILTDPWFSYLYALHIVKGRWIEAEDIIMTNVNQSHFYARDVIKGKLPEKMHNMMILHAIQNPNDFWAKQYFEYIKDLDETRL